MVINQIILGNCLDVIPKQIENESIDLVVTSPHIMLVEIMGIIMTIFLGKNTINGVKIGWKKFFEF